MLHKHEVSESDLLYLLSQGDEWAYSEIYKQFAETLIEYTESKLGSYDDAQDIVHDLFTDLWNKKRTLNVRDGLRGYLFGAARYMVINRIRKNIVRGDYAEQEGRKGEWQQSFEPELLARELERTVDMYLKKLPLKTQNIFRKSRIQHKTNKEIAEELNISEQTVKNQISIALKHLRDKLASIPMVFLLFMLFFVLLTHKRS